MERFDPYYYLPFFRETIDTLNKSRFQIVKLKEVCRKITDGTHHTPQYIDHGIPFLSVKDVRENTVNFNDTKFISEAEHSILSRRCKPEPHDVLLTKIGTFGLAAVVPENAPEFSLFVSVALLKIISQANPHYVGYYLNTQHSRMQMNRFLKGIAQPDLHLEEIAKISIPLPPLETQDYMVKIMQSAHAQKRQKEQEADVLLDSINGYVLTELGIQIPAVEKKKCFTVYAGGIEGRLDPEYNHPKLEAYKAPKSYFALKKIKELRIDIKTGLPVRQDFRSKDGEYPYYGANGIIGYMDDYTHDGRYLVVGQDGYIGNHYVVEGKFWASNHNWVATFREGINLEYVKAFLDAWNYEYLITGGVIPKLTKEAFESISIPIPPFEIQKQIANETMRRQSEAVKLRQEAVEEWEAAKAQFEEQLLSGEVS